MISTPTVLVVGAGASAPFGIPTAAEVYRQIVERPWFGEFSQGRIPADQTAIAQLCRVTGATFEQAWPVAQRLAHAQSESIDALLERHPADALVQRLGKALLAMTIEPSLHKVQELSTPPGDWTRLVRQKMTEGASTFERFKANTLHFVTFNFDTLIEHRLARSLAALFPGVAYVAARRFADGLVTHVHGTLEAPRDPLAMDQWLSEAIGRIAVVHQEVPSEKLELIRTTLRQAGIICFLGFGYHEANVRKLGFPLNSSDVGLVCGTAYGFGEGERSELRKFFQQHHSVSLGGEREDCERFLKDKHVLRT